MTANQSAATPRYLLGGRRNFLISQSLPCRCIIGEVQQGVNPCAADINLEVQMRTRGHARAAHEADGLALLHRLPDTGAHLAHVGVKGHIAVAVVDDEIVSVAARVVSSGCDHAVRGSQDRHSVSRTDVNAAVGFVDAQDGVQPGAKKGSYIVAGGAGPDINALCNNLRSVPQVSQTRAESLAESLGSGLEI